MKLEKILLHQMLIVKDEKLEEVLEVIVNYHKLLSLLYSLKFFFN